MSEFKDIVKLATDAYKGNVEKYSVGQSQELLRQALVEANGGDTILFELNSEFDTKENLEFITWYLGEFGYRTQFSNTDVYRIMRTDPRKE